MVKQIAKTGCNVLLVQKSILRDAVTDLSLDFCAKARHVMYYKGLLQDAMFKPRKCAQFFDFRYSSIVPVNLLGSLWKLHMIALDWNVTHKFIALKRYNMLDGCKCVET